MSKLWGAAVMVGLAVRIVRSRRRRALHPDGRSFAGHLEVWGFAGVPVGSDLVDRPARHRATVRVSKGIGTRGDRPDVLGLAIRVHGTDRDEDLLLSTTGTGRLSRHLPMPRRRFDTCYGTITSYRTGAGRKLYIAAGPARHATPLGRTLESVVAAAENEDHARLTLSVSHGGWTRAFGQVVFGAPLPAGTDAALAFDPIRNAPTDLHPSGAVHGVRAFAYRISQRWRGATPAPANPTAIARTLA